MFNDRLVAGITGLGICVPEKVLTNADLERMVDTSDAWIQERTGIRERRIAVSGETAATLGLQASKEALASAGLAPEEVELIIVATVTPDMLFPSTACLIQNGLGALNAAAFDLEAGCSSFIYAMVVGAQFVSSGCYRNVLVVGSDVMSRVTNWEDRATCILLGDGAGAAVLESVEPPRGILSTYLRADGSGAELIMIPAGGGRLPASARTVEEKAHFLTMNGREVFRVGVRAMEEASLEVLRRADLGPDAVDYLIPHQANIRMVDALAKRLSIPSEKVIVNVDRYGNTSSASIPIAFHEAVCDGRIKSGESLVLLVAVGAGLTWGAVALRY